MITRSDHRQVCYRWSRVSVVGRRAHMTAALVTVALTNLALGLLIALGMGGLGLETVDWPGSFVFGADFAAAGLVFAGIAAVTVQVTEYGHPAPAWRWG